MIARDFHSGRRFDTLTGVRNFVVLAVSAAFLLLAALLPHQTVFAADSPKVCDYVTDGALKGKCTSCMNTTPPGVWTALGCIPSSPSGFITKFLRFGTGIAGGIALMLIVFGGLQMMTAAGNPEQLNSGKELIAGAISGLLMVIFSIFLLRFIGYDILAIPGFQ